MKNVGYMISLSNGELFGYLQLYKCLNSRRSTLLSQTIIMLHVGFT